MPTPTLASSGYLVASLIRLESAPGPTCKLFVGAVSLLLAFVTAPRIFAWAPAALTGQRLT